MASDFSGTDPCWVADLPIAIDYEWRLRVAKFGDGYEQRTLDGINALDRSWQAVYENRPQSVILAMAAYLQTQKAHSFYWYNPVVKATLRVFCDSWSIEWSFKRSPKGSNPINYGTLTLDLRAANGVSV